MRPRDRHVEALVGAGRGQATFYLVREFHGLSTMIEGHAQAALTRVRQGRGRDHGAGDDACARCATGSAPAAFDFLKIDVEGAEPDVLLGGDWQRFRPKVIVVEALAPYTLAPAFGRMGAASGRARLSLRLVRQPQSLLRRRGGGRARGLLRDRAGRLRCGAGSSATPSRR